MNTEKEQTTADKYPTQEERAAAMDALTPVAATVDELDDPANFLQAIFTIKDKGVIDGLYEVTHLLENLLSFFLLADNAVAFKKHYHNAANLSVYLPEMIYRLNRYVVSNYAQACLEKIDLENNGTHEKHHINFLIEHYGQMAKVVAFEQKLRDSEKAQTTN